MFSLLLDHVARHVRLSEREAQLFCDALTVKRLRKNQYLLREGDVCRYEYFVVKGGLRQYETSTTGKERIIHFGFEDWWLTDKLSLVTKMPSFYNIQALETTEVLAIRKEALEQLFEQIPLLERYFHIVLQNTFALWQRRILDLQKPAEERYQAFLADYGAIEQRLTQQHIASYLGITRETLSRIRAGRTKKNS